MEISPAYEGKHPVIEALSSLPTQLDSFEESADLLAGLRLDDPPFYLPKPCNEPYKYDSRFMLHFFRPGFRFTDEIEISAELNRERFALNNIFYGYQRDEMRDEMLVIKTPNAFHGADTSVLSERMRREMEVLTQGDAPFWIKNLSANNLSTAKCKLWLQTLHRSSLYLYLIQLRREFSVFAQSLHFS